jgi:hypothetical protein
MDYCYHTAGGKARLNKGDRAKVMDLGSFKGEAAAKAACEAHYAKACRMADAAKRARPTAFYL